MATRKKVVEVFPQECCGVCNWSYKNDDEFICDVNPPQVIVIKDQETDEPVIGWARGAVIDPNDRICRFFKQRLHA